MSGAVSLLFSIAGADAISAASARNWPIATPNRVWRESQRSLRIWRRLQPPYQCSRHAGGRRGARLGAQPARRPLRRAGRRLGPGRRRGEPFGADHPPSAQPPMTGAASAMSCSWRSQRMVSALNEQLERPAAVRRRAPSGAGPIKIGTLAELRAAAMPSELFEEAARAANDRSRRGRAGGDRRQGLGIASPLVPDRARC